MEFCSLIKWTSSFDFYGLMCGILQLYSNYVSKQKNPDQTPRSAASDLVLHCVRMSHKRALEWNKGMNYLLFFKKNRQ